MCGWQQPSRWHADDNNRHSIAPHMYTYAGHRGVGQHSESETALAYSSCKACGSNMVCMPSCGRRTVVTYVCGSHM
eukprot:358604-Chlamydomonas_euryale.AAC.1